MDIREGPPGQGGFPFLATVDCDHVDKPLGGHSLKFACDVGREDIVKVKVGESNGEVYGEVAATRLCGRSDSAPTACIRFVCGAMGCPARFGGKPSGSNTTVFDPAVIEREMAGAQFDDDRDGRGRRSTRVDPQRGGASRREIDALKLIGRLPAAHRQQTRATAIAVHRGAAGKTPRAVPPSVSDAQ